MSKERLEEYRKILPKNVFLTEYLGEWLDDDGVVFSNLKKCIQHNTVSQTDRLFFGVDWSNQTDNDETVLVAFNQFGKMVFLKYFNNLTPLGQIDIIYKELEPYLKQISVIASETNSLGEPYTELLKAKSQILSQKVNGFNTSNQSKNAIVTNFQVALENGDATILDDEHLVSELGYFSAEFNPKTRTVTYNAPQGLHDDCVMATLIAYDAYKNNNVKGVYKYR